MTEPQRHKGTKERQMCEWRQAGECSEVFDTGCDNAFVLVTGTPKLNHFVFCPYCGREITEVDDGSSES